MHAKCYQRSRSAFTLIELLVVIAIIAILAVVVVLTLNPAQLLAQSRDANRLSDLSTMSDAVNLYNTDQSGSPSYTLGNASDAYLSVYDPTATSTDQCTGLGVATAPGSYMYHCSASSTYRNINTTGWLPVNFSSLSAGSPVSSLPVDPVNQTSSDLYYTYQTNGTQFEVTAFLESSKYAKTGATDGGTDPTLAEAGSGVATIPDVGRGLVGYWPLNEGNGSTTIDWSGGGNNGTWQGTPSGTSGYYSPGHVWQWGGTVVSSTNSYVDLGAAYSQYLEMPTATSSANIPSYTLSIWIDRTLTADGGIAFGKIGYNTGISDAAFGLWDSSDNYYGVAYTTSGNTWYMATMTYNQKTQTASCYINAQLIGTINMSGKIMMANTADLTIGSSAPWDFPGGILNDARIYDRALSATEIQEIYNAEK